MSHKRHGLRPSNFSQPAQEQVAALAEPQLVEQLPVLVVPPRAFARVRPALAKTRKNEAAVMCANVQLSDASWKYATKKDTIKAIKDNIQKLKGR